MLSRSCTNSETPRITRGDEVGEQDDRISNLPEEIIHYILSFLDTIDVVRASLVSTKWRCFWLSIPFLNLDSNLFGFHDVDPEGDLDVNVWEQKCEEIDQKFKDFVNWVLMSQNGSIDIQRFRLHLYSPTYRDHQTMCRWISAVTRRKVHEFELVSSMPNTTIKLPSCLLNCESLVKLKLAFSTEFGGLMELQLPTYTGFSRLKSLTLVYLQLSCNYILFRNLISSCPVLENLDMRCCILYDFKILDISSASLKNLSIDNYDLLYLDRTEHRSLKYEVKVACPNLVSFTFTAYSTLAFSFEGLHSLENVFIAFFQFEDYETDEEASRVMCKILQGIRNTKVLKLSMILSQLLCLTLDEPECFSTSFYNLKSLILCVGKSHWEMQSIINFLEYTPNLEALTIFFEEQEPTELWEVIDKPISCLTYHLKVVELVDVNGNENQLELVRFLLSNGRVLQKMSIGWENSVENRMAITTKVMNFPKSSSNVALTFLEPTVGAHIYQYHYGYSK